MAVKPAARRTPRIRPLRARRALANALQGFRAWLGLTQQGLAGAAGVSRATIARWEAGTSPLPAWLAGPLTDRLSGDCPGDTQGLSEAVSVALAKAPPGPAIEILRAAAVSKNAQTFHVLTRILRGGAA